MARRLRPDERALWRKVTASVRPLAEIAAIELEPAPDVELAAPPLRPAPVPAAQHDVQRPGAAVPRMGV
ncbi:MAG: Smr/MutS family protein, partial [Allosphingosinicella sp.]